MTAQTPGGAQGLLRRKCLPANGKKQLSTLNTGLYYYDYVFIKKLRRRQKNNSGVGQVPFGFSENEGESKTWGECITLVKGADIPGAAKTTKPYDKTGQRGQLELC
ncbi:hypothetical protein [Acidovorax sp. 62]|uniref:hypothetical protein n=1 Tax=Acidovorax sp. 62 TaxID=2035203 RepID=UPI00117857BD|nr:hypothetical protein [Acidovorax sp. 62]